MSRIRYIVGERSAITGSDAALDAFVSNAPIEHIEDIPAAFSWMASVAASRALHVHMVDAKTHMRWVRSHDPWNILRYPSGLYRVALTFPGSSNGMLVSDDVGEASRANIRLSVVDGTEIDNRTAASHPTVPRSRLPFSR